MSEKVKDGQETEESDAEWQATLTRFISFVNARDMSTDEIAGAAGLNRDLASKLKKGKRPKMHSPNRRKVRTFLRMMGQDSSGFSRETSVRETLHRTATLLAAERLEEMAAQLRAEAGGEVVKARQSIEVVSAVESALADQPSKGGRKQPARGRRQVKRPKRAQGGRGEGG